MTTASAVYVGKAYFEGDGQGWSEIYYLSGNTVAAAKAALLSIVDARHAMLHSDYACVYASVTQLGVPRKTFAVKPTAAVGALTDATMQCNRIADAVWLRQETAAGDNANRYIHGVPDKCVISNAYLPDTGAGAWDPLLTAFIAVLITNSGYLKKDKTVTPVGLSVVQYANVIRRGVTGHKVGKPFDQQRGRKSVG